ncbi:serine/threonine protein kinase [Streptomyces sp. NPDC050418]|uniref:serine/threonine protein kinase n=1 Tax=Streptomyces sp. NPDC050418 TaxID=3365612 RepID=UPI0037B89809
MLSSPSPSPSTPRSTVIVEPPGSRGPADLLHLSAGDLLAFGRDMSACGLHLPEPGLSRIAGVITPADSYWTLSNHSRHHTYAVENPEGAGEYLKVPPLRLRCPVPFEISRVVLPTRDGLVSFRVYAPEHAFDDESDSLTGHLTPVPFALDRTAKYFLVLVALCEPRLKDRSYVAIPTAEQVAARLRPLPACGDITPSAVHYHIKYLADTKLRIGSKSPGVQGRKQEGLVDFALRFNVVREEHLPLLP